MVLSFPVGFWAFVMPSFALSYIKADLGDPLDSIWVIIAQNVVQAVAITVLGRLSDLFGRRWFQIGDGMVGLAGYITASRAPDMNSLIGANILIGVGSAVQIQCSVVGGELLQNKHRFLYNSFTVLVFAPISAISPGIGESFLCRSAAGWRAVYYLLAAVTATAQVLFLFCYHPPKFNQLHTRHSKMHFIKSFDYVGLLLFCAGGVLFLMGVSWPEISLAWHSAKVIATLTVGGVTFITFVLWEYYADPAVPVFPLKLFKSRNFVCILFCSAMGAMLFYALSITYPEETVLLYRQPENKSGWYASSMTAGVLAGQCTAGLTIKLFGHIRWQVIASCVLFTTFCGANAASVSVSAAALFSALAGYHMEVATVSGAPLMVDPKDFGIAIGALYSSRVFFSACASAIFVSILNNKIHSNMVLRMEEQDLANARASASDDDVLGRRRCPEENLLQQDEEIFAPLPYK
ncbi:hypothetical protein PV08_04879 [Exophiala spinifera]|uniref:Major facilitator superfamily (MFS) profile domain-containing protein n=1 Tax=Exophiala spinifera TaxID=91928 RepID=A0A0D2C207_9EURO|nr:uncharacterized protein PV08_04879 [Exophiala spinifera]KIW17684.1 hypothetical protein PV08_04879 [Exophiala spinifera]